MWKASQNGQEVFFLQPENLAVIKKEVISSYREKTPEGKELTG